MSAPGEVRAVPDFTSAEYIAYRDEQRKELKESCPYLRDADMDDTIKEMWLEEQEELQEELRKEELGQTGLLQTGLSEGLSESREKESEKKAEDDAGGSSPGETGDLDRSGSWICRHLYQTFYRHFKRFIAIYQT